MYPSTQLSQSDKVVNFRQGIVKMVKRDLVKGEVVCCKIAGNVVAAVVLVGGSTKIRVRNLKTDRIAHLKTLKAVRSILKTL